MKNSDIYLGLTDIHLRETIAELISTSSNLRYEANKMETSLNNTQKYSLILLQQAEVDINKAKLHKKAALIMVAADVLLERFEWYEFDVSDYMVATDVLLERFECDVSDYIEDYNSRTYKPFIGTEKEYATLVDKFNKENNI